MPKKSSKKAKSQRSRETALLEKVLKFGKAYVETGQQTYEKLFKERTLRNLERKARELGFDVTPMAFTALVS